MLRTSLFRYVTKTLLIVFFVTSLRALVACTPVTPGPDPTTEPIATRTDFQSPSPYPSNTPQDTPTPTPTVRITPTMQPTASETPWFTADLPRPLYMLVEEERAQGGSIWVLNPGDSEARPVVTFSNNIARFDLSPVDERLAYGTADGRIYVQEPGAEDKLVVDTSIDAPYPTTINGLSWSPDGTRLAYTVAFQDENGGFRSSDYPVRPTGIWVLALDETQPTWLLSNTYLDKNYDPLDFSVYTDPVWSPDGRALAISEMLWEASRVVLFYPIRPVNKKSEVYHVQFINASWSADSSGLLLGGQYYTDHADVIWVSRDGSKKRVLMDSVKNNLESRVPLDLGSGIAFTATRNSEDSSPILFYGQPHDGGYQWKEVNPNPLCGEKITKLSVPGREDPIISLHCEKNILLLIDPAEGSTRQIDLSPFFRPMNGHASDFRWAGKEERTQ